jgi:hypothetical protein
MKKLIYTSLFALFAVTLHGQVIYTSRTTFDLAHPINYIIDFDNFGPDGTFYPSGLTASTPFGNVVFSGIPQTATSTEILSATHFGFSSPANFVLYDNGGQFVTNSLLITLPANTFSFGTDVISPSAIVTEPYTFTIFNGSTVLGVITPVISASGTYTFTGFDSLTNPITSIQVQITNAIGNPQPVLDNFTLVPEPSTWAAGGLAFAMLLCTQRKRISAMLGARAV